MIRPASRITLAVLIAALAMPAFAQDFPLTIEHKFGTTIIPEEPERVASVDFGGIDNLLALGVEPVTVRQWRVQDGFELTAGPWAEPYLTTEPVVLEGDLDFEAIAETEPDVIVALWSGIDLADYEKLSLIAPVVAVPEGVGDYALSWDERALLTGRAIGAEDRAMEQIEAIRGRLAAIRADHPQWESLTAVVGGVANGIPNVYTRHDVRAQFLAALGLETPAALDALTDDEGFWIKLSPEDIAPFDADVIVWYGGSAEVQSILNFPARPFLRAYETGGEIFLPDDVVAAYARVSLLSVPVMLDALVPMLEAAADGDPGTAVPDARH
jgi:iron complex transport system substrate-binding protein